MADQKQEPSLTAWACGIAAVMCLIAIADLPYGFYILLRWVVTAAAVAAAFKFIEPKRPALLFAAIGLALLFNPIVRVHFDKEVWRVLDFIAAVVHSVMAWAATGVRKQLAGGAV